VHLLDVSGVSLQSQRSVESKGAEVFIGQEKSKDAAQLKVQVVDHHLR
jgi:hypothetical protein